MLVPDAVMGVNQFVYPQVPYNPEAAHQPILRNAAAMSRFNEFGIGTIPPRQALVSSSNATG